MVEGARRKLAAVMFTDITGYTAMVQEDEAAALDRIARYREVHNTLTSRYNGRVIQFSGDGSLSIYDSAIDAVRCAIEMQQSFLQDVDMPVRIGIHLGDVVFRDDTVYGDGVNVASRIESAGIPGAILISENVQKEIANHTDIQTVRLGAYQLKNVKGPVDIFAVSNSGLRVPKAKHGWSGKLRTWHALVLGVILIAAYNLYFKSGVPPWKRDNAVRNERIAVRLFQDYSHLNDPLLRQMAADWIQKELLETPNATVVAFESATRTPDLNLALARPEALAFSQSTGALNILKGEIYQFGDTLEFSAQIIDLATGKFEPVTWKSRCLAKDPMTGITHLASQIRGWWTTKDEHVLSPPTVEAYRHYLRARAVWRENDTLAEQELKLAIKADSTFIDAYFLMMDLYYNNNRNADHEQLVHKVSRRFTNLTPRQQNLLEIEQSQLNGDNLKTYKLYQRELEVDPKDVLINTSGMLYALEYVNAPEKALDLYQLVPHNALESASGNIRLDRLRLAIRAYLKLGNIKAANQLCTTIPLTEYDAYEVVVMARAAGKDTAALNKLITRAYDSGLDAASLTGHCARQFAMLSDTALQYHYAREAKKLLSRGVSATTIDALYYNAEFQAALDTMSTWLKKYPDDPYVTKYAGLLQAYLGQDSAARNQVEKLDTLNSEVRYGWTPYYQATILAQLGDIDTALDKVGKALTEGLLFTDKTMDCDPDLKPLWGHPRFKAMLHPLDRDMNR